MACFTDLPNELLCEVCSLLDQEDLANVSLISRNLRQIAEPFLYHDVLLNTFQKQLPLFELFLRTIRSRPALPNYIQSLTLRWYPVREPVWYDRHELPTPPPLDAWLFGLMMSMFGVSHPPRLQGEHVIPLLHALPRLQVLHLWPTNHLGILDESLPGADLPKLEHLRELKCCWENSRCALNQATFMFLVMRPSLCTLEARLFADRCSTQWQPIPDSCIGKSTATDLRLSYGHVYLGTLERVLKVPRVLTCFSYTNLPTVLLNLQALGQALERILHPTLQFLALTLGDVGDEWNCRWNHWPYRAIGSLREWPVLSSIRSSLAVLLGPGRSETTLHLIDVLPVVIRELEIENGRHWTAPEIADEVVEMLHLRGMGDFRQLAVITIPIEVHAAARWIGVACDVAGVQLVLTRYW